MTEAVHACPPDGSNATPLKSDDLPRFIRPAGWISARRYAAGRLRAYTRTRLGS